MKTATAFLLAAVLAALVGFVGVGVGRLERDLARADTHIIASEYEPLTPILDRADRAYQYVSLVPLASASGVRRLNDLRATRALVQYWQRRYEAVAPDQPDPVASVPSDNVALQFVTANASFRGGLASVKDKASAIAALERAAGGYQTVLRNAEMHYDAAYNYEYVVRLRNELEKGRRKAPPPEPARGREGAPGTQPETAVDDSSFKVYVPLEQEQLEKNKPGDAGKQAPIRKKG